MKASIAGTAAKSGTHPLPLRSPRSTSHGRRPAGSASSGHSSGQCVAHEASQHVKVGEKVSGAARRSVFTLGSTKWSTMVKIKMEATTAKSVTSARHFGPGR